MAWRYAGVNPLAVLPKEGIYEGDDTGDFWEVEADTGYSVLYFRRNTDSRSLLLRHGAGLRHCYTSFKHYSPVVNLCCFLINQVLTLKRPKMCVFTLITKCFP